MTVIRALPIHEMDQKFFERRVARVKEAISSWGGRLCDIKYSVPTEPEGSRMEEERGDYRAVLFYEIDVAEKPERPGSESIRS